uniref:Uncharacterized protein n=1 Tax=Oryza sativa subsp. japonica TaxID=39947 RepID=Q69IX8_ORYSJ|nr:hypothetical protein [Oryza sativa Japonica Group]
MAISDDIEAVLLVNPKEPQFKGEDREDQSQGGYSSETAPQGRGGPRPPPLFAGNPPELLLPRSSVKGDPVRPRAIVVAVIFLRVGRRFR